MKNALRVQHGQPGLVSKRICLILLSFFIVNLAFTQQVKILFDATKAEAAGNADWVIDANAHNLGYSSGPAILNAGSESNPQRLPDPVQSAVIANTPETYWMGALSFWAIDCVKKGYQVETLPYNGRITYGDVSNPQDLSNYNAYIICEPNILFTLAEKTAILSFVSNGGGLFMIGNHSGADRNNDGFDPPVIWNDLMQNNASGNSNPFGLLFDQLDFSQTSSNLAALPANDSILHGEMGNVTTVKWSNGTSITLDPAANANVKALVYRTNVAGATGNTGVMVACSRYGSGKLLAIGDSSPCDDGTGDVNDGLFPGYNGDVSPNHRNLLMNSTIWLVTDAHHTYTFTGSGNWDIPSNWAGGLVPPAILASGDTIIIDHEVSGECILNIAQQITAGAELIVRTGKNLVIPGELFIQQ